MKKTINKIVGLFSLGLLLFAAQVSYARSDTQTMFQDAWSFMQSNTADSAAGFKKSFGANEAASLNIVNCGPKKCNLNFRVCLLPYRPHWYRGFRRIP